MGPGLLDPQYWHRLHHLIKANKIVIKRPLVALPAGGVALKPGRIGAGAVGPAVLAQAAPSNPIKITAIYVPEAHIMYGVP